MSTANLPCLPPEPNTVVPRAGSDLMLRWLPASSRTEALYLWRKLEFGLSHPRNACSSLWTEVWLNHYGGVVPHQFAIAMRDGKTCGITLLTEGVEQTAGPFKLNTRHIGTAGEPDAESVCVEYNSVLAAPEDRAEFIHALWQWARQQTNCDEFRLDGFDAASIEPFLASNPQSLVKRRPSYFFELDSVRETGADPLTKLGSQTRGNIRRTLRSLGDARGEWAETTSRAEELFHQMMQLHQARWNADGQPGVYSSARFREFHLELLNRAVPLGLMGIFGVTAGGRLIGCCQFLIDHRRVLHYQCGRAPSSGRVSYGMAIDYLCICEALRRGYEAVDYLAGETEHKRRMSTHQAEMAWVVWRRTSLKNAAIDAMRHIKRATSQLGRSDSSTTLGTDTPPIGAAAPSESAE
jgi:CelD/BcsL family acetyltransferase involved in cellulose biosynthesis